MDVHLGGKGIGLAEMTQMGVPVPGGFTITTDACRAYMSSGKELPAGLESEEARSAGRIPKMMPVRRENTNAAARTVRSASMER